MELTQRRKDAETQKGRWDFQPAAWQLGGLALNFYAAPDGAG